ncbi:unnamed protein product [Heterobilharzia americana]|nr:unnamed protein product [Heterobilharzia americana]
MGIDDIPYHHDKSMNQSYLESVIEKHFYSSNANGSDSDIIEAFLPSLSISSQSSAVEQQQQQCIPFTYKLSEYQNHYAAMESSIQMNNSPLVNGVNPSVYRQSDDYDAYSYVSGNENSGIYHTHTSTPEFLNQSMCKERNDEHHLIASSFNTGKPSLTTPLKTSRTMNDNQSYYLPSMYTQKSPNIYNQNPKNSKLRRHSSKLSSIVRKEHQREQDKNRTRTLNVAFCCLRSCLPEIPKDTKLTKIRTLRYAITYIRQLMDILQETDPVPSATAVTLDATPNSLKMEPEYDQSSMRDSGYLSFLDR